MNIFFFDRDPVVCAQMHCDKHVVKMILEYAQLLSTAHRVIDGISVGKVLTLADRCMNDSLYKATHVNHPSAKWVRHSKSNYAWLYSLLVAVCDEYSYRYEKIHLTDTKLRDMLSSSPRNIDDSGFSSPWRAMPDQYKVDRGTDLYCELSYQKYFIGEKRHIAKWTGREEPIWFLE